MHCFSKIIGPLKTWFYKIYEETLFFKIPLRNLKIITHYVIINNYRFVYGSFSGQFSKRQDKKICFNSGKVFSWHKIIWNKLRAGKKRFLALQAIVTSLSTTQHCHCSIKAVENKWACSKISLFWKNRLASL